MQVVTILWYTNALLVEGVQFKGFIFDHFFKQRRKIISKLCTMMMGIQNILNINQDSLLLGDPFYYVVSRIQRFKIMTIRLYMVRLYQATRACLGGKYYLLSLSVRTRVCENASVMRKRDNKIPLVHRWLMFI